MDLHRYLARIGVARPPKPTLSALIAMHRAHLRAIPYENLDVQLGRQVTIERPPIFEKLVGRRRGGWCYEMNGLFGWVLEQAGFSVTRVAGAVLRETFGADAIGNHLVLKVDLEEGVYLADVGFGDGPLEPFRVVPGPFLSGGFTYSLSRLDERWWRLHNHPKGGAQSFDFTLEAADETLLDAQCAHLQSAPNSPFVQNLVCQRHVEDGILILRGRVVRKLTPAGFDDRILNDAEELVRFVGEGFALDVPEISSLWGKICERHSATLAT